MSNFDLSTSILHNLPIEVLELTNRVENPLIREGITTLAELVAALEHGITNLPNMGTGGEQEVLTKLTELMSRESELDGAALERLKRVGLVSVAPIPEEVASISITRLDMPLRAHNALIRAGVLTIGQLADMKMRDLLQVGNLGPTAVEAINLALLSALGASDVLLQSERDIVLAAEVESNARPLLIEVNSDEIPNLINLIIPCAKNLFNILEQTRDYEVLKRRYGLENSKEYTLQEIGDYFDITRERVRQIERKAVRRLYSTIFESAYSLQYRLPISFLDEARAFSNILVAQGNLISEISLADIVSKRYGLQINERVIRVTRLLLSILNYEPVTPGTFGVPIHPVWTTGDIDREQLVTALRTVHEMLYGSDLPVALFDIKITLNKKRKVKIDLSYLDLALNLHPYIESDSEDHYQVRIEHLPSLADKAFRILSEEQRPLHMRDIARILNQRLLAVGVKDATSGRSIASQMAGDKRFSAVGRSGQWALANWSHITTRTIMDIMREFFHGRGSKATVDEVYSFVSERRPDITRNSIVIYLTNSPDKFIRVGSNEYELVEWGSKPYTPLTRRGNRNSAERQNGRTAEQQLLEASIKVLSSVPGRAMPMSDLVRRLSDDFNIPSSTSYQILGKVPNLRVMPLGEGTSRKIVELVDEELITPPAPKGKIATIQKEIAAFLERQPEHKAKIADVVEYIISKKKLAPSKPTVYAALTKMEEQVGKEHAATGHYCYLRQPSTSHHKVHNTTLKFPQIATVTDESLRTELERAVKFLTLEMVDLGLFQLGRMFESLLKAFLIAARAKGTFPVSDHDLSKLVFMIECVDRNKVTNKKHLLTLLREQRNERAHGEIPDLAERERLLQYAPFLADLYIEYITFFYQKRQSL